MVALIIIGAEYMAKATSMQEEMGNVTNLIELRADNERHKLFLLTIPGIIVTLNM